MGRAAAATAVRSDLDDEALALLLRTRPSLFELMSLWPKDKQKKLALFIGRGPSGDPQVRAQLCSVERGGAPARRRARSPEELPVTFELGDGRTIVLSLAAVRAQPG